MSLLRLRSIGLAMLGAAASAAGQTPQQAAPAAETIGYGETVSNFLTADDAMFQDSTLFKAYIFSGTAGDTITVHLASADFNAQLIVTDSLQNPIDSDDNSGGSCNAYLTTVLPATGQYLIFATTRGPGERGQFQLTLQSGRQPPESTAPCRGFVDHRGIIWVGGAVEGTLGPGDPKINDEFYQVWLLPETDGQPFTADLVSDDFDALLILVRGFAEVVLANDDGAGGCNSRIVHAPTNLRPYRLVVRSRDKNKGGKYLLRVSSGIQPLVDQPPCQRGSDGSQP